MSNSLAGEDTEDDSSAWWVVVAVKGEALKANPFPSLVEVAAFLKTLPEDAEGVIVGGTRAYVTKGPHRYLTGPGLPEPIPLFTAPSIGAPDHSTGLGNGDDKPGQDSDYVALIAAEEPDPPVDDEDDPLGDDDPD